MDYKLAFEKFLEITDNILLVFDSKGKIIAAGPYSARALGYSVEELSGKELTFLTADKYKDKAVEMFLSALNGSKISGEVYFVSKSGESIHCSIRFERLGIDGNLAILCAGDCAFHHRRKALYEETEFLQAKSRFLASISHELRTPLNGIMGMAELLSGTELTQMQKDFLSAITASSEELLRVVSDILAFSGSTAYTSQKTEFNIKDAVSAVARTFSVKAAEKGISLFAECPPVKIFGDKYALMHILVNLVDNGVKFTQRGEVKITVEPQYEAQGKARMRFSVIDTGVGINESDFGKLFKDFSQADNSLNRKYCGAGMGLAAAKSLAQSLGGKIWLESERGKGSAFYFEADFDLAKESTEPTIIAEKAAQYSARKPIKMARILVVEDNKINLALDQMILSGAGYEVDIAVCGAEAIEKISSRAYDLVLMDIMMPEMNGFDA
ncbi:MAG: ATP-binding protein, partial [Elusimicrobia bacterium]|nr:ATP-binding protein [Elusimicrobiota bacterium]